MEEYNQFISKHKFGPDYRTVKEWSIVYEIPKINFVKESEYGKAAKVKEVIDSKNELHRDFIGLISFLCYPNGNCKENEGYISLMFVERELFYEGCDMNFTLTLLDADRSSRFPQSFSVDFSENINSRKKSSDNTKTFGLSRYMRRDRLLSSDIFCSETLLVQCEVQYYPHENFHMPYRMYLNSPDEDEMLIIENPDHHLWKILSEKSAYFRKLLVEIRASRIYLFDSDDFRSLNIIGKSILNNIDPRFNNLDEVFNLYKFASKVLMPEFKKKCSDYLKMHMNSNVVFDAIVMADMHNDDDLKKFAIQYAVEHWQEAVDSKSWTLLRVKDSQDSVKGNWIYFEMFHPDLAKEILEYKGSMEASAIENNIEQTETQRLLDFPFYQ